MIAYTYVGYVAWLWVRAQCAPRPVRRGADEPLVSVVMVVRNEEAVLAEKLRNLLALDYPAERCRDRGGLGWIDGSGPKPFCASMRATRGCISCSTRLRRGKAAGLNDGMKRGAAERLSCSRMRGRRSNRAPLRLLMENFADPEVGGVSGELMLGDPASGETGRGMGLYWRIEKRVRELESASGSVVGATGALYAVTARTVVEPFRRTRSWTTYSFR